MQASLLEMVLAIAIAGLIFAAAVIPTTQTAVAYQQAEANVRAATWQVTATVRAEQIAGGIWRDTDPPANHDALTRARPGRLQVGDWQLRQRDGSVEQKWKSGDWTPIAEPVQGLAFEYLLNSGSWTSSVNNAQLGDVLALQFGWSEPGTGRPYGGLAVAPDRAFSAGLIQLPQPTLSAPYKRKDYERAIAFSLGSWQ